jgi:hypothetical protein
VYRLDNLRFLSRTWSPLVLCMLYIMCHLRVLRVTCYVLCVSCVFSVRCVRSVFWLAFFFFGLGWGSGGYFIFHSIWHFICQQLEINTISDHQTCSLCKAKCNYAKKSIDFALHALFSV